MRKINLAIVGATGLVGRTFLRMLEEIKIENYVNQIYLFASAKNDGKIVKLAKKTLKIEILCEKNVKNKKIDYVFFSAGEKIAKEFAPVFNQIGAVVIDNSSAFRMQKNIPLIVPEVNMAAANGMLIANPNCSTIQCMLPLKVLEDNFKIKSINYTTFQAVSGSGLKGLDDLARGKNGYPPEFYPHQIFNNVLPHIGSFQPNGYTSEELKMINETKKILNLANIPISATCVRIPVENCHSVAIDVELEKPFSVTKIQELMEKMPNITVLDNPLQNNYPQPLIAKGKNGVYVGRLRKNPTNPNMLHFFCVADNLRKGAAGNGIQILLELIKK